MPAYVVYFGHRMARRYLAQAETTGDTANGWRPMIWVKELARAEKFGSAEAARDFALDRLRHSYFNVAVAPTQGLPTDDLGGSPAAMRIAA